MQILTDILQYLSTNEVELIQWENLNYQQKIKIENAILSTNKPVGLCLPQNVQELSKIIKYTHQNRLSVMILGKGSKINWGNLITDCNLVICTEKLNKIVEHSVGDFTITVQAGMTLKELKNHLKKFNQYLPIDPAFPDTATIGGIIATADGGSLRHKYNGIRDLILGVSLIRNDGEIVKAGGKVVKNVAGYDLMKLLTGSYGSLGIITEVTLRLFPILENAKTILITGNSHNIDQAIQLLKNSALTPLKADLLSASLIQELNLGNSMGMLVQFQGILESINYQSEHLINIAKNLGLKTEILPEDQTDQLYDKINQLLTEINSNCGVTCKTGILPSFAVKMLEKLTELVVIKQQAIIHLGSGIGRIYLEQEKLLNSLKTMREYCQENQGYLIVLDAPLRVKKEFDSFGYNGNAKYLMRQIKQKFDPQNMFNPDIFI